MTELLTELWSPVKRPSVVEARSKRPFNGCLCLSFALAVRVHADTEKGPPFHTRLVLFCNIVVPTQQLHLEVAVPRQTCRSNLAARVVLAVTPVEVLRSTVIVRVDQLVRECVRHLLLRCEVVVAHDDALWCPEAATHLGVAVPDFEKVVSYLATRLGQLFDHKLDEWFPTRGVFHHVLTVCLSSALEPRVRRVLLGICHRFQ